MAILIEGTTVVVTTSSLDARFPGGAAAFEQQAPNTTYHSDGVLAGVSFMIPADARLFAKMLTTRGYVDPWTTHTEEIAVVDQSEGLLTKCDWLKIDLSTVVGPDGTPCGVTIAWKGDTEPGNFTAPAGWYPDRMFRISQADLEQNYEMVKLVQASARGGALATYRHRQTGRLAFISRPSIVPTDVEEKYAELGRALAEVMAMPPTKDQLKRGYELCDRATATIEGMAGAHLGLLYIQGIAARMAGRWSVAEGAFRKATELWPDQVDAWLELTWALSSLGRMDEALTAAQHTVELCPGSAAAHANLGGVLFQSGQAEQALPAIERAFELDPDDWRIQRSREQVLAALEERSTPPVSNRPWYKRWLR